MRVGCAEHIQHATRIRRPVEFAIRPCAKQRIEGAMIDATASDLQRWVEVAIALLRHGGPDPSADDRGHE